MKKQMCMRLLSVIGLISCGSEFKKFYVIDVPRVAAAQVMNIPNNDLTTCSAHPYCLQFPARPAQATQIRFVSLSPKSEAVDVSIVSVVAQRDARLGLDSRANLGGGGESAYCAQEDASLTLTKNTTLSAVQQDAPMRIEEFVFDVTPVAWTLLVDTLFVKKCSPIFRVNYKAVSASGDDKGFINVFMLPEPTDTTSWNLLSAKALEKGLSGAEAGALVASYKALAQSNIPPKIDDLVPANGGVISSGENTLEVKLDKSVDTDEKAKTRVGWFVSHGALDFQNKASVEWEPEEIGEVSAFVMVRDLQGAVVYRFAKYTAQ